MVASMVACTSQYLQAEAYRTRACDDSGESDSDSGESNDDSSESDDNSSESGEDYVYVVSIKQRKGTTREPVTYNPSPVQACSSGDQVPSCLSRAASARTTASSSSEW